MSDYHRVYMKLVDLIERGHTVQITKCLRGFEVSVFEARYSHDHTHTDGETLSETMDQAHLCARARWPKEDD